MTREEDTRLANQLWADYARSHDPRTREQIVHQFQRLAFSIANRFTRRGVQNEDLYQVALMGLVKAVDRFDPSTNHRFSTFATPTILGEIKRYFRDHSWNLHVPRGLQETAQKVSRATRELSEQLGRSPSTAEIAARMGVPEDQVLEALAMENANRPLSLDGEIRKLDGDGPCILEQSLGVEDRGLGTAEDRVSVGQALRRLSEPLREILRLRYLQDLTQRDVARKLGLSQMQVSRMERRAITELRVQFGVH